MFWAGCHLLLSWRNHVSLYTNNNNKKDSGGLKKTAEENDDDDRNRVGV